MGVNGGFQTYLPLIRAQKFRELFGFDSSFLADFAPCIIAAIWVAVSQLRRSLDLFLLGVLLALCCSPIALAKVWPMLADAMSIASRDHVEGLMQLLSMSYAAASVGLFLAGGPVCLLGA